MVGMSDLTEQQGDAGSTEDLEGLLERIGRADERDGRVHLSAILDQLGRRSFAPVLLLGGLITLAPLIGDIPGVPTTMAVLVSLTAGQMLLRRERIWLPRWLLDRSVDRGKLEKAVTKLRGPARWVDRILRPRLRGLVRGPGSYAIPVGCLLIAFIMPVMELIPFSANLGGAALTAFGLALVAGDGALALVGYAVTAGIVAVVVTQL